VAESDRFNANVDAVDVRWRPTVPVTAANYPSVQQTTYSLETSMPRTRPSPLEVATS
jgi:hypothetical protein